MSDGNDAARSSPAAEAVRFLDLAIERYRTAYAQAQHITVTDSLVMSHLSTAPDRRLTPTQLTTLLAMPSGTLTTVIDRLTVAGHAVRVPNPADGRSVLVELTEAGACSLRDHRGPLLDAIERNVPAAERDEFAGWLTAIARDLTVAAEQLA